VVRRRCLLQGLYRRADDHGQVADPEIDRSRAHVPERLLLFCLASDTDWQKASVTHATAQHMMVRGLIERDQTASRFMLSDQGRAVLGALLHGAQGAR
jgi:hypothetical protein